MANVCVLCRHPNRPEVDALILSGASLRDVAGQYGTTKSSVLRHRQHIAAPLAKIEERKAFDLERCLLEGLEMLARDLHEDDWRCRHSAVNTIAKCAELAVSMRPKQDQRPLAAKLAEADRLGAEVVDLTRRLREKQGT